MAWKANQLNKRTRGCRLGGRCEFLHADLSDLNSAYTSWVKQAGGAVGMVTRPPLPEALDLHFKSLNIVNPLSCAEWWFGSPPDRIPLVTFTISGMLGHDQAICDKHRDAGSGTHEGETFWKSTKDFSGYLLHATSVAAAMDILAAGSINPSPQSTVGPGIYAFEVKACPPNSTLTRHIMLMFQCSEFLYSKINITPRVEHVALLPQLQLSATLSLAQALPDGKLDLVSAWERCRTGGYNGGAAFLMETHGMLISRNGKNAPREKAVPPGTVAHAGDQFSAHPSSVSYVKVIFAKDCIMGELNTRLDHIGYTPDIDKASTQLEVYRRHPRRGQAAEGKAERESGHGRRRSRSTRRETLQHPTCASVERNTAPSQAPLSPFDVVEVPSAGLHFSNSIDHWPSHTAPPPSHYRGTYLQCDRYGNYWEGGYLAYGYYGNRL